MVQKKKRGPYLPDLQTINALCPNRNDSYPVPAAFYDFLKEIDKQDAINRYVWYNCPEGLDGELIERILYYRGQGAFFYQAETDTFYFLPYTLNGNIDIYGQYNAITPLPFHGATEDRTANGDLKVFVPGLTKEVIKDVPIEANLNMALNGAVLLHDRALGVSQITTPRERINDVIIDMMSEMPAMARTHLLSSCGIKGMRVNGPEEESNVNAASDSVERAALTGNPWIAIQGATDFQDLAGIGGIDTDQYYKVMEHLDNLRLSGYGLKSSGIGDKDNAYVNNIQATHMSQNVGLVYNDGLARRQHFCDIINSIWGIGISCEASEVVTNADTNMNGVIADESDMSGIPGNQDKGGIETNEVNV